MIKARPPVGLLLAFFLAFMSPALAAAPNTPDAKELLTKVEAVLNEITTIEARFVQVSSDGSTAEGRILVSRPGKLRMDYDPPAKLQVIADGVTLNIIDGELQELTSIPLGLTAANFLLRDPISFSDGLKVTGLRQEPGLIKIDVVQTEAPEAGSVEIVLTDNPIQLIQWTVTDAQGEKTRVTLFDQRRGVSAGFFNFLVNPPWMQGRDNGR